MISAETVERISRLRPDSLPVLTVYAQVAADGDSHLSLQTRLRSLLRDVRSMADDRSVERAVRMSLRGDIERIESELAEERWRPGTVAFFSCSGAGIFEQVQLPRQVRDRAVLDATPYVRPMLAVLDSFHRCCIVVVDKESARMWELEQDRLIGERDVVGEALRKPDFAGWYGLEEHRVRNHADELAKRHYKQVAAAVEQIFRAERFELLVIGGHEYEAARLLEQLAPEVRARVAGTFPVDPRTLTLTHVRDNAMRVVDEHERAQEGRLVEEVVAAAANAAGTGALGLERCLWAGSIGAVSLMLVDDDVTAPGVVCSASDWLGLTGQTCPVCGAATRPTEDVVEELAQKVVGDGGRVEHVESETELRGHDVMAALRFPLPPAPRADAG